MGCAGSRPVRRVAVTATGLERLGRTVTGSAAGDDRIVQGVEEVDRDVGHLDLVVFVALSLDPVVIGGWLERVTDANRCYLAVEERIMVSSVLREFPGEFAEHIELHRCPRPRRLPIPKLLDLIDGRAIYDEAFWRKQPDWTYEALRPVEGV